VEAREEKEKEKNSKEKGSMASDGDVIPTLCLTRPFFSACGLPDFTNYVQVRVEGTAGGGEGQKGSNILIFFPCLHPPTGAIIPRFLSVLGLCRDFGLHFLGVGGPGPIGSLRRELLRAVGRRHADQGGGGSGHGVAVLADALGPCEHPLRCPRGVRERN